MERIKDEPGLGCQIDQEERLKSAERKIQELDNHYQILVNHMISILNSMNDNIQTLTGVLQARGVLEKKPGEDSETIKPTENGSNDIRVEQEEEKTQEQKEEDNQDALEATQTMKELKKEEVD